VSVGNRSHFGNRPFGNRGGFGNGFGNRCWNCGGFGGGFGWGFGFGLWPGWGFGYPWLGFGYWDPFYWDSLSWGWPGYGYYGYPAAYPYGYGYGYNTYNDNSSYSSPDNNSSSPDTESESNSDSNSVTAAPVDQGWSQPYSGANATVPVLLYMKNGSVYSARDYWFSNDQFHYVLMNGREVVIDADQLDMKRTNEENAKSGVRFVVKSQPNSPPPPPDDAAPATPASGNPGPAN